MFELGYKKAEIEKGHIFFYENPAAMNTWMPRIPVSCTCFEDKYQCIDISEYLGVIDWDKVEVDTPILVRDLEIDGWKKRHFAFFDGKRVHAWEGGVTSWSTENHKRVAPWNYAKLAGDKT